MVAAVTYGLTGFDAAATGAWMMFVGPIGTGIGYFVITGTEDLVRYFSRRTPQRRSYARHHKRMEELERVRQERERQERERQERERQERERQERERQERERQDHENRYRQKSKRGRASQEEDAGNSADADRPWYEVLGVTERASSEEISSAYRSMMRQYHPDKVSTMGIDIRELAEKRSKEINSAYDQAMKAARSR